MKSFAWFLLSSICMLAILFFVNWNPVNDAGSFAPTLPQLAVSELVLPQSGIVDVMTMDFVENVDDLFDDSSVVILLGGMHCFPNQPEVLRYWQDQLDEGKTNRVIALFSDPLLGVEQNIHEARVLRRASGAKFPFLVSTISEFDLRSMKIAMPQVIAVEGSRVSGVVQPPRKKPKVAS